MYHCNFTLDILNYLKYAVPQEVQGNEDPCTVCTSQCNFLQVCMSLSKKKAIHILSVTEDKIIPLKEIPLPEAPLHMVRMTICLNLILVEWFKSVFCSFDLL